MAAGPMKSSKVSTFFPFLLISEEDVCLHLLSPGWQSNVEGAGLQFGAVGVALFLCCPSLVVHSILVVVLLCLELLWMTLSLTIGKWPLLQGILI